MKRNLNRAGRNAGTGIHILAWLLFAAAVFLTFCFLIREPETLSEPLTDVLFGVFAKAAYLLPVLLTAGAVALPGRHADRRVLGDAILLLALLIAAAGCLAAAQAGDEKIAADFPVFYENGKAGLGGGAAGGFLAFLLTAVFGHTFGRIALYALAGLLLPVAFWRVAVTQRESWKTLFRGIGRGIAATVGFFGSCRKKIRCAKANRGPAGEAMRREALFDDDYIAADTGMQDLQITALGIHESRTAQAAEEHPTLQKTVAGTSRPTERAERQSFSPFSWDGPAETAQETSRPAEPERRQASAETPTDNVMDIPAKDVFGSGFLPFDDAIRATVADKPSTYTERAVPPVAERLSAERPNAQPVTPRREETPSVREEAPAAPERVETPPSPAAPADGKTVAFYENQPEHCEPVYQPATYTARVEKPFAASYPQNDAPASSRFSLPGQNAPEQMTAPSPAAPSYASSYPSYTPYTPPTPPPREAAPEPFCKPEEPPAYRTPEPVRPVEEPTLTVRREMLSPDPTLTLPAEEPADEPAQDIPTDLWEDENETDLPDEPEQPSET